MNNYTIHYSEALEEAERLKKVTSNPHKVVRESCDCDYSRNCFRCAGEGGYFDVVEQVVLKVESAPIKSCREVQSERDEWEAA